ncbi:MAG TPA: DUF1062 domain-containing protein [Candidatus Eisenbergiella merdavium]|uniref:DUF1062 domain-containing protein n=1 Tax=Candidatus Eisenbergiella merdavium TaxID=2838551 RepID=A0A9D2SPJ2_9FIRM|nr:DUF1062 domain-containing protein [Candidatus Eisenbergiella merdavium]
MTNGMKAGTQKRPDRCGDFPREDEIWRIVPVKPPVVRRQCPGCRAGLFESTGKFRVNANKGRLDVWLIYSCVRCKRTWNMEILERTDTRKISEQERKGFQENDGETALRSACDSRLLQRNRAEALWKTMEYQVERSPWRKMGAEKDGPKERSVRTCAVALQNEYHLPVRIGKLLAGELGLSRKALEALAESGRLILPEGWTLRTKPGEGALQKHAVLLFLLSESDGNQITVGKEKYLYDY